MSLDTTYDTMDEDEDFSTLTYFYATGKEFYSTYVNAFTDVEFPQRREPVHITGKELSMNDGCGIR